MCADLATRPIEWSRFWVPQTHAEAGRGNRQQTEHQALFPYCLTQSDCAARIKCFHLIISANNYKTNTESTGHTQKKIHKHIDSGGNVAQNIIWQNTHQWHPSIVSLCVLTGGGCGCRVTIFTTHYSLEDIVKHWRQRELIPKMRTIPP